jgi:hypothetical protein
VFGNEVCYSYLSVNQYSSGLWNRRLGHQSGYTTIVLVKNELHICALILNGRQICNSFLTMDMYNDLELSLPPNTRSDDNAKAQSCPTAAVQSSPCRQSLFHTARYPHKVQHPPCSGIQSISSLSSSSNIHGVWWSNIRSP